MSAQEQVINDIKQLPDHALQALSVIVKEFAARFSEKESSNPATDSSQKRPFSDLFGEWHGQMWMSDDFDEPLEEMREYME